MATFAYRTDVFAAREQHQFVSAATTLPADIFAQRERRTTAAMLTPKKVPVWLYVRPHPILLSYTTLGGALPDWADPVLQSLSERWGAETGWDSYNARPTNPGKAISLLNILSDLLRNEDRPPLITPLPDGGVQAEWHREGRALEIVVAEHNPPSYYYFDGATEEEEEDDLALHYDHVQNLIARFS